MDYTPKITYIFGNYALKLIDSYTYSKHEFSGVLSYLLKQDATGKLSKRTLKSLKNEWSVHNFCYKLGILRDRTRDVDFNYDLETSHKLYSLLYNLCGPISKLFIS